MPRSRQPDPQPDLSPGALALGVAIRRARLAAGLTQVGLSERTGIPQNHISAYERGTRAFPGAERLIALEDALGLPRGALRAVSGWAVAQAYPKQGVPEGVFIPNPSPTLRRILDELTALDEDRLARLARELGLPPED